MRPPPPDDTLRHALRRLGESGARAEQFLASASEQLSGDGPVAAQHAAYALREALMSIVSLGGKRPQGMRDAAEEVVRGWQADASAERLNLSVRRLDDVLRGPGPNALRLEQAVTRLARVRPTRATADLLDQFVNALDSASGWLHADTPPEHIAVATVYERTCVVLRDLFGPLSLRLTAMDDLVALDSPGAHDVVVLKQRLGDERHLLYLCDRISGPGWFRALRDDVLLLPSAEAPWSAAPYVARVAESHPADASAWLARLPQDLNAKQVGDVLRIAQIVKVDIDGVLRLARRHLDVFDVRFQVDRVLRAMPPEQRDTRTVRSLIGASLAHTLGEKRGALDMYMAAEQLQIAATAAAGGNPAWLTMVAHRAREVTDGMSPVRLRVILPLSELRPSAARRPLELISAGLLQVAAASAQADVPVADRLARLRLTPEPLASRLIAQHLLDHLPATAEHGSDFIAGQIANNDWPSPEELVLVRRLFADEVPGVDAAIAAALGSAPDVSAVLEEPMVEATIRAHRWLVAVPASAAPAWHDADVVITEQIGVASQDGVMMRVSEARFTGAASPIALDELTALPPLQAAARVAAWRGEPGSSFQAPNANGLAGTLRQVIDADPARWIAADPVELIHALRHPLYITVLLQALRERAADLGADAERLVAVTELVRSEPWRVEDLGADKDGAVTPWSQPADKAIELLGRLGGLGMLHDEIADRAWTQVVEAHRQRGDTSAYVDQERDPLAAAINRPSMRALEAAFLIGQTDERIPDERLLSLLDEVLDLDGADGLQGRAILATRLPYLRDGAPQWFGDREERIFGDAAPGHLGPATFDLYLEWGAAYGPLLQEERQRVIAALSRERREDATHHLLHGLIWRLPGYEVPAVAEILTGAGSAAVSYAVQWLGWALADDNDVDLAPVTELWRQLLDRNLSADAYSGLGWMAVNDRIDEGAWLTLMHDTAIATAGAVDGAERVAERAAQSPSDPLAALIIARLLAGDPTPWDLQRIGEFGLEVLALTSDASAASDLRERLLERGFHEAKDV